MKSRLSGDIRKFLEIDYRYNVLPIKTFKQNNGWSCGSASLKMVLSYYGCRKSVREISKLCKTNKRNGTSFKDIILASRRLGFNCVVQDKMDISTVKIFINSQIPVITCHQFSPEMGDTHYNVIIGYGLEELIIAEPARWYASYLKIPIDKFINKWYDCERNTNREGLIVTPYKST